MFGQHAVHDILVDVDAEGVREDARNSRTAKPRIARLEVDDSLDQCPARAPRTGFLGARVRREQAAVRATHQRGRKRQECRGAYGDRELSDASRAEEERPESTKQSVAQREVGGPLATTTKNDQLLLEHEILGDHRSDATGATQLRGYDREVQ